LKTYLIISYAVKGIGMTHPMINGPRPAPISFTYLDLILASVGPGITNKKVGMWGGRSDDEGDER
jgi:hypothetical protein